MKAKKQKKSKKEKLKKSKSIEKDITKDFFNYLSETQ
jgi:hypothetical protein